MATRNILDSIGAIIGTLTLDDTTSENEWTAALTPYTVANPITAPVPLLKTYSKNESGAVTTSSATALTVGAMSFKPEPGTYVVNFSGSIYTDGASATGEFGIYVDGVLVAETRRDIKCNLSLLGGLVSISLNSIGVGTFTGSQIVLNGGQVLDIRFRSTNGGTIGFNERVLTLLKVQG